MQTAFCLAISLAKYSAASSSHHFGKCAEGLCNTKCMLLEGENGVWDVNPWALSVLEFKKGLKFLLSAPRYIVLRVSGLQSNLQQATNCYLL